MNASYELKIHLNNTALCLNKCNIKINVSWLIYWRLRTLISRNIPLKDLICGKIWLDVYVYKHNLACITPMPPSTKSFTYIRIGHEPLSSSLYVIEGFAPIDATLNLILARYRRCRHGLQLSTLHTTLKYVSIPTNIILYFHVRNIKSW